MTSASMSAAGTRRTDPARSAAPWKGRRTGVSVPASEQCPRPQPVLIRLNVAGAVSAQPLLLTLCQRHRQYADNLLYHLVLDLEDIGQIAVVAVRP